MFKRLDAIVEKYLEQGVNENGATAGSAIRATGAATADAHTVSPDGAECGYRSGAADTDRARPHQGALSECHCQRPQPEV